MSLLKRSVALAAVIALLSSSAAYGQSYNRNDRRDPPSNPSANPDRGLSIGGSVDPLPNKGLGTAAAATTALQGRIAGEVEDRLLDYVDTFEAELKLILFTDFDRDDLLEEFEKDEKIEQDDKAFEQLEEALIDFDPLSVNRACKKLGVDQARLDALLARVEITSTFEQLKRKINDGESSLGINRVIRKFSRDLRNTDLQRTKVVALTELSDLIAAGARIRDAVEGGSLPGLSRGKNVEWPVGEVPTVFYPRIPRGQVFVLGDDCLVAGALDRNSDIEFAMKSVAQAMNLPVYRDALPVPNTDHSNKPKSGIIIRNPDDTGVTLGYRLYDYDDWSRNKRTAAAEDRKISPGQSFSYSEKKSYLISFDRGSKWTEPQLNTLADGTFHFESDPKLGWQIHADNYRLTIDNTDNPNDFYYVVDGRRSLVAAGRTKEHSSQYALVITFDIDGRKQYNTKTFSKSGGEAVWKVGVNIETNNWDLYNRDDIPVAFD